MQHNYIQTPYVLEAVLPIVVFGHYTNVWSLNYIVSKETITNIHTKKQYLQDCLSSTSLPQSAGKDT